MNDEAEGGLERFGLTVDSAMALARGVRRSIAGYCLRFGFFEEARDLLRRIANEDPEGMYYRMGLAQALVACGDVEEADALSERLVGEFPDKARVTAARCEALLALGRENEARACYDNPGDAYSYWGHVGEAALRRGDRETARHALNRALAIFRERQSADPAILTPVYLWAALAALGDDSRFSRELGEMRLAEEAKIREALAKPARSERPRQAKAPARPLHRPPAEPRPQAADILPDSEPSSDLEAHLRRHFGFEGFRRGQQQVIERVLDGKSVLAVMPTGAGKSLCYQLPAMLADGVTLVVSPLIALMKDQVDGLPASVQSHATLVNSTLESDEIERRMRDIRAGRYKMVYAAPERLRQTPFLHALASRGVSLFVVDEAHCVSMWGHDFRPDYLFIGNALHYLGHPTVLAMTATAKPEMRREISDYFGRQLAVISTGTHRPNLVLESVVVRGQEEKMRELVRLCKEMDGTGIVYTRSRKKTEALSRLLKMNGVRASYYHAGMIDEERAGAHESFMDDRYRVMCATVAFGMGVDKPDVRFVIHFSPPDSLESYYQEAGRAGRDGRTSRCILLSTPGDRALITRWMHDEIMGIELPKKCYAILRDMTADYPFAAVHVDDIAREAGVDETRVRVAVSILENVGLAKRHLDVPATATVGLTAKGAGGGDDEFARFVESARLRTGQSIGFETMRLCSQCAISPPEIERKLLDWRARDWVRYHGSGRTMLLERLPAPVDSRQSLEKLLAQHKEAQEARAAAIFDYVETRRCRHDYIAEHFGEPSIEGCASCDNCAGTRQPAPSTPGGRAGERGKPKALRSTLSDADMRRKILETAAMVEGHVGFTGLVRVLKGSIESGIKRDRCPNFGILANEPKATVGRRVGELLEQGLLVRDESEYRLISLSETGRGELK